MCNETKVRVQYFFWVIIVSPLFCFGSNAETIKNQDFLSSRMNLLVIDTIPSYLPYDAFCNRNPGECDLNGPSLIELNPEIKNAMHQVTSVVNREIRFILDIEQYGAEDYWSYPRSGQGDCEDKALEKRLRLVSFGIPRSAMRIAIGFHKQLYYSHCLLTIETNEGTYVLDSFSDNVMIWHQTPYNYEMRERVDGEWERFDQGTWSKEPLFETLSK